MEILLRLMGKLVSVCLVVMFFTGAAHANPNTDQLILKCEFSFNIEEGKKIIEHGERVRYYKLIGEQLYVFFSNDEEWRSVKYTSVDSYLRVRAGSIEFGWSDDDGESKRQRINRRTGEYTARITYVNPPAVQTHRGSCKPSSGPKLTKPRF